MFEMKIDENSILQIVYQSYFMIFHGVSYFMVSHVHCCSACKVQSQSGLLGEFLRFCPGISGRGDRPQRIDAL